jgi:hypothetical protein
VHEFKCPLLPRNPAPEAGQSAPVTPTSAGAFSFGQCSQRNAPGDGGGRRGLHGAGNLTIALRHADCGNGGETAVGKPTLRRLLGSVVRTIAQLTLRVGDEPQLVIRPGRVVQLAVEILALHLDGAEAAAAQSDP